MKLFHLWVNGQAEGPFDEDELRRMRARGEIESGSMLSTDSGESWLRYDALFKEPSLTSRTTGFVLTPHAHLSAVRAVSCYAELRGILKICFAIAALPVLAGAAGIALGALKAYGSMQFVLLVAGIASGLFGLALLVAAYQASTLLIDIADLLITISERQKRTSSE